MPLYFWNGQASDSRASAFLESQEFDFVASRQPQMNLCGLTSKLTGTLCRVQLSDLLGLTFAKLPFSHLSNFPLAC